MSHCAKCGLPFQGRKNGNPKKVKRFCSVACQQGAIRVARAEALKVLRENFAHLEDMVQGLYADGCVQMIRGALETLGMLPRST